MNLLKKNKVLSLILVLAFFLRIIGLTPNFEQHPDEPIIINPSGKIALNVIEHLNPDPNVGVPFPFQYATTIFYLHALIEGSVLSAGYIIHKLTGATFELSKGAFGYPNFIEFFTNIGPTAMASNLLWFHRLPSVIFGVLTVLLVYKTVILLFKNRTLALLSAIALAVMPHHVRDSHWATVNIIQSFFFLLGFYLSAKIWKNPSFKNCLVASICIGFAISIKYFPLPLIPLLFFLFFARKKLKLGHFIIAGLSVPIGYFIGMPYVFIHFDKMVEFYKFTVSYYSPHKAIDQSIIFRFLPSYFHSFHIKFFFENGVGQVMSIFGVIGTIYGLIRWRIIALVLLIIPVVNLLFITFYLEAIYETLMIPALPFFAIFIAMGVLWLLLSFNRIFNKKIIATIIPIGITFASPLLSSFDASFACTKPITEKEAHDWIANNIPSGAVIAHQPNMRMPSKDFKFIRSEPKENFFLSEIQEQGAQYAALHSGYTDRYAQWLDDNILLSSYTKENEFTNLVFSDFKENAQLLKEFVRPVMCVNSRIYIFRVPELVSPLKNLKEIDLNKFEVVKKDAPSGTTSKIDGDILTYKFDHKSLMSKFTEGSLKPAFYGIPLRSPFIQINPGETYTAKMIVKRKTDPGKITDGFVRLDFYDKNKNLILARLSSRMKLEDSNWQDLIITSLAPKQAYFATTSFQTSIVNEDYEYLIKSASINY